MATVWDNIQPLTIRYASNGIALVSDQYATWGCLDAVSLQAAIEWAKRTPGRSGDAAGLDYDEFRRRIPGRIPNGNVATRAEDAARFSAALDEFGLDELGALLRSQGQSKQGE